MKPLAATAPPLNHTHRTRLSIAWIAWTLVISLGAWWFLSIGFWVVVGLCWIVWYLVRRSWHLTGVTYFLALCSVPALLLLARFSIVRNDVAQSWAIAIVPPLLAFGALASLRRTDNGQRARHHGTMRLAGAAALCALGLVNVRRVRGETRREALSADALSAFATCYEMERGRSFPPWNNRRWPPANARLTTERWLPSDANDLSGPVGNSGIGDYKISSSNVDLMGWWRPRNAEVVEINWTYRGLGGFRGLFHRDRRDLVGRGEWYQDAFSAELPSTLSLRMHAVTCADER